MLQREWDGKTTINMKKYFTFNTSTSTNYTSPANYTRANRNTGVSLMATITNTETHRKIMYKIK